MALTNPKIFGLKIGNKFTDVENRRLVLRNLRIPEPDLDIIRGSQDASGSRGDFINFSRLYSLVKSISELIFSFLSILNCPFPS